MHFASEYQTPERQSIRLQSPHSFKAHTFLKEHKFNTLIKNKLKINNLCKSYYYQKPALWEIKYYLTDVLIFRNFSSLKFVRKKLGERPGGKKKRDESLKCLWNDPTLMTCLLSQTQLRKSRGFFTDVFSEFIPENQCYLPHCLHILKLWFHGEVSFIHLFLETFCLITVTLMIYWKNNELGTYTAVLCKFLYYL